MLREFWPPVPVCALPDLWEKTASGCASHAKNSHASFSFFLQPCCIASDSSDVSAGSHHSERNWWRKGSCMGASGPSSTALPPAQSQGSCLSKSRNKAAPTTLPLWTPPPKRETHLDQCPQLSLVCSVSSLQWLSRSPSPTLSPLQLLAHTAPTGEGFPRSHLLHKAPALDLSLTMAPCLWDLLDFCAWKTRIFPMCLCLWWFPVLTHQVCFPNCAVLN